MLIENKPFLYSSQLISGVIVHVLVVLFPLILRVLQKYRDGKSETVMYISIIKLLYEIVNIVKILQF